MGRKITFKGKTKECAFYKGMPWPAKKALTPEMKKFEKSTGKNAVYRGQVTGTYEYWKYWADYDKSLKKPRGFQKGHKHSKGRVSGVTKPTAVRRTNKTKQLTQDEVAAMYKRKFKVKSVNTKSKKFALFASKMLEKHTT